MVDLSCPDWQERIRNGQSLIPSIPLDEGEARRAIAIFNMLRLPDVIGQPAMAEAAGTWFREIVAALFGGIVDGARLFRELFCLVPKKNSKTTNGAALMLTALLMNRRPRAELLLIGPTIEIAKLAFSQVIGMIDADTEGVLQKRMQIREHLREIVDRRTKAVLKVKAFDTNVLTGVKPVGVLLDELHEIAKVADAARVIGQIRGGLIPNPEAFLMFITTQSDTPPAGVFKDELNKARGVRDGKLKAPMLPVLYEFPPEIGARTPFGQTPPWYDTSLWWMVTPNRDRSITIARMAEEFETAKLVGLEEATRWASQHLNIEIGIGLKTDRWAGTDYWERGTEPGLSLQDLLDRCEVVVVGIDGGGLDDLYGLAVLGREPGEVEITMMIDGVRTRRNVKRWLLWSRAWCHNGVLERRKSIAPQLKDFERDGDLTIVGDRLDDISSIVDVVRTVRDSGLLGGVAVDPAGLGELVDELAGIDVTQDNKLLIGVGQGYRLMNAIKTAERRLANGTLKHGGSPLMTWCVGNLKIEPTATAIRATKQNAGDAKIDPAMAMFDAIDLMSTNPEAIGRSAYETHDLLVI